MSKETKFYLRLGAILIAALILFMLFKGCTNSLKELRETRKPPEQQKGRVDTVKKVIRDTVKIPVPVPYAVKVPGEVIYTDTGRTIRDSSGVYQVPDEQIDLIVNDYLTERYYKNVQTGKGWKVTKLDTIFQNNLMGSKLIVETEQETITKIVTRPPRREGFLGASALRLPEGQFYFGPRFTYKDKRGRVFGTAVLQGPGGLVYQVDVSFKLSLAKPFK